MAIKQCSKCGSEFQCTAPIAGCWCEQYSLTGESLAHLKGNYKDCLCPGCLSGFADNNATQETIRTNKE